MRSGWEAPMTPDEKVAQLLALARSPPVPTRTGGTGEGLARTLLGVE